MKIAYYEKNLCQDDFFLFWVSSIYHYIKIWSRKWTILTTNIVARNFPQPHDMSMYSLCSTHCTHMRMPSSKNVEMRHNLATVGSTFLPLLITCNEHYLKKSVIMLHCLNLNNNIYIVFDVFIILLSYYYEQSEFLPTFICLLSTFLCNR